METKEEPAGVTKEGIRSQGKKIFIIAAMGIFGIGLAIYTLFKSKLCRKQNSSEE